MIQVKYNRRALCAGDDAYNGIYDIEKPEDAVLRALIEILPHRGNDHDWPLPSNHVGWLIYSNIDLKHVECCDML